MQKGVFFFKFYVLGIPDGIMLIVDLLKESELEAGYSVDTAQNYKPFIVNPNNTIHLVSRQLRGR